MCDTVILYIFETGGLGNSEYIYNIHTNNKA